MFFSYLYEYKQLNSQDQKTVSVPKDFSLDLSNSVCEYEVNPLTNDKVITEIQNFNTK